MRQLTYIKSLMTFYYPCWTSGKAARVRVSSFARKTKMVLRARCEPLVRVHLEIRAKELKRHHGSINFSVTVTFTKKDPSFLLPAARPPPSTASSATTSPLHCLSAAAAAPLPLPPTTSASAHLVAPIQQPLPPPQRQKEATTASIHVVASIQQSLPLPPPY